MPKSSHNHKRLAKAHTKLSSGTFGTPYHSFIAGSFPLLSLNQQQEQQAVRELSEPVNVETNDETVNDETNDETMPEPVNDETNQEVQPEPVNDETNQEAQPEVQPEPVNDETN